MGRFSRPRHDLIQLAGSYASPRVGIGDELQCEIRGMVPVRGWHDGPIMWPTTCELHRRHTLIVTATLAEALRTETVIAIQHHWGVGRSTIHRWKTALGIGVAIATKRVRREICVDMAHDEYANERRSESITPERLARLREHPRGPDRKPRKK